MGQKALDTRPRKPANWLATVQRPKGATQYWKNTKGPTMKNRSYSPYFSTVYDQSEPAGYIGRGTHYSILSCAQWCDEHMVPHPDHSANIQKFAVIWDEDHDERIIDVINAGYFRGLLGPVKFIGERKGSLTVLVDQAFWAVYDKEAYLKEWAHIASNMNGDYWPAYVYAFGDPDGEPMIIQDDLENTSTYLRNIWNQWDLSAAHRKPAMHEYESLDE